MAALACLCLAVGFSYGGLTAVVGNPGGAAGSATLLYTHTYGGGPPCSSVPATGGIAATSSFACSGGLQSTTATPASGSTSATDAISYRGSASAAQVTQTVAATSCGPQRFANSPDAANPMLARYGTAFHTSGGPMDSAGYVTLDGANPGGYATAVLSQAQPNPLVSLGTTFGLGIWFKTTSTSGGPLFGIGTSAVNASGGNDRILYMKTSGQLGFIQNTTGNTTTTTTSYNDGHWHFAYVTMSAVSVFGLGVTSTTKIYVDGTTAGSGGGLLVGYSNDTGYWHLGWSPVAGLPSYFTGSLADFVAFGNVAAPAVPTAAQRATQAAFSAWAGSAKDLWPLNDTGTSTFAGPYPGLGTDPCRTVNVSWGFTNPTSCGWSPNSQTSACTDPPASSLSAFVAAGAQTIASPAPGTTQTATLKLSRGSNYDTAFAPGLRLYTPLVFRATAGSWANTFTWADANSVFLA